jgi:hypothetical protein
MHKLFFKLLIISLLFNLFTFCNNNNRQTDENNKDATKLDERPKREVELKYFETETGWGYDVIINGKNYIHQVHLPCECGGEGFETKEKAMKAAEFLKQKIENNNRSLQISRTQLDSLGAL